MNDVLYKTFSGNHNNGIVINEKHLVLYWPQKTIKIATEAFNINYKGPISFHEIQWAPTSLR